jgi:hypothetical protein
MGWRFQTEHRDHIEGARGNLAIVNKCTTLRRDR